MHIHIDIYTKLINRYTDVYTRYIYIYIYILYIMKHKKA